MSFYINYAIFTFCLFLSTRSWHHPNAQSDVELVLISSRQPPGCLICVQHLSSQSGLHCSKPLLVCPGCVQISHSNTLLFVCASQTTDLGDRHFKTLLFCFGWEKFKILLLSKIKLCFSSGVQWKRELSTVNIYKIHLTNFENTTGYWVSNDVPMENAK